MSKENVTFRENSRQSTANVQGMMSSMISSKSPTQNNNNFTLDKKKYQLIIDELRAQIQLHEEQNRQNELTIRKLVGINKKNKERIKMLEVQTEKAQLEEEEKIVNLEKQLLQFCQEQEESMKEVFEREIYQMASNLDLLKAEIENLQREKENLVKMNQRLLNNEKILLQQQKKKIEIDNIKIQDLSEQITHEKESLTERIMGLATNSADSKPPLSHELSLSSLQNYRVLAQQPQSSTNTTSRKKQRPSSELTNYLSRNRSPQNLSLQNLKRPSSNQGAHNNTMQDQSLQYFQKGQKNSVSVSQFLNIQNQDQNESQFSAHKQEILDQLCRIFKIEDENLLVECVKKTEQVLKSVPRLENFLTKIYVFVFGPQNQAPSLEDIIPTLKTWKKKSQLHDQMLREVSLIRDMFQIPASSQLLQELELIKLQVDDYLRFLNVSRAQLHLNHLTGQQILEEIINLLVNSNKSHQ